MSNTTCGSIILGLNNKDEVTLRDYFAAKAMQSLIAHTTWGNLRDVPRSAYIVADQMLKEREIENDPTKR